jgi:excisionase family DNA binding protein
MTVAETAEYAGFKQRAIREHIARGHLPAYMPRGSRVLRILQADVDDWLTAGGRVPSAHLGNGGAEAVG